MKRTAKWMKGLTIKELKHLAEMSATGKPTLTSLKTNRAAQIKQKEENPNGLEPCWECRMIAGKVGLE